MKTNGVSPLLKKELLRRARRNPNYSLRAMARSLEMDPSTLSKIISGKRRLGEASAQALLKKLEIDPGALDDSFDSLSPEETENLSEWQDFVILEQLGIPKFKATKGNLANALGLPLGEIESSLSKLKRLGLIEIKKTGLIGEKTSGHTTNVSKTTSHVKKNLQKQFLEKAISSIDFDRLEERDMTTMTFAIDSQKFEEARERIRAFRREMVEFLGNTRKSKDRVYNLSIAFYPATKKEI